VSTPTNEETEPSQRAPRGAVAGRIAAKLAAALAPALLEVDDESGRHAVPAGSETHFKVLVVSTAFQGLGLLERHRRVHEVLREELAGGVHALSIRAQTPAEHEAARAPFRSPPCAGGSAPGAAG
jgi:BolA protein